MGNPFDNTDWIMYIPTTSVALVRNLDPEVSMQVVRVMEQRITPDMLFALFGMYGDVMRVKILHSKPDNAFIQFAHPQQWYFEPFSL